MSLVKFKWPALTACTLVLVAAVSLVICQPLLTAAPAEKHALRLDPPAGPTDKTLAPDHRAAYAEQVRPVLAKYCFACHGDDWGTCRKSSTTGSVGSISSAPTIAEPGDHRGGRKA